MTIAALCRPPRLPAVALVGCLLAGACAKVKYPRCASDEDCRGQGEVCVQGQCQQCRADADCAAHGPPGALCVRGRCEAPAGTCTTDADCIAAGIVGSCHDGRCQAQCQSAADCPDGHPCRDGRCQPGCQDSGACAAGEVCLAGACRPAAEAEVEPGASISPACQPQQGRAGELLRLPPVQFPFNKFDLTPEAQAALQQTAACLKEAPATFAVVVEGHCDDRGTQEYNLALGQRRAQAVVDYLLRLDVEAAHLRPRSKGENEPLCSEASEACYSQNRRVSFLQNVGAGG